MDFGEQIKKLRKTYGLTQEQLAEKLFISRQAVSNWENDRNLPDIEMLITIACAFDISLDELILGGKKMNNLTEKLIRDGSETKRARLNLICTIIGTVLFLLGIACLVVRAMTVDYIDAQGVLYEAFFLVPTAFLFFFGGFVTFLVTSIRNIIALFSKAQPDGSKNRRAYIIISGGVVLLCVALLVLLRIANS